MEIKLSDFGFATRIKPGERLFCGTSIYMAPEIIDQLPYNEKVDIWGTGVIAYVMLSGQLPFNGRINQIRRQQRANINFSAAPWRYISNDAKNFIKACLTLDPKDRPSAL